MLKIKCASSTGGKAGKGQNKTSTVQVVDVDKKNGTYRVVKQFRYKMGWYSYKIIAVEKAEKYIKERNKT